MLVEKAYFSLKTVGRVARNMNFDVLLLDAVYENDYTGEITRDLRCTLRPLLGISTATR